MQSPHFFYNHVNETRVYKQLQCLSTIEYGVYQAWTVPSVLLPMKFVKTYNTVLAGRGVEFRVLSTKILNDWTKYGHNFESLG